VKILTMHSSKGLEFPVVAIPGLGFMPYGDQVPKEEAKLLYVAMTRAMDRLVMTCHKQTDFTTRIKAAQRRVAA
jgi:superfamily I DNA/RNA helicase